MKSGWIVLVVVGVALIVVYWLAVRGAGVPVQAVEVREQAITEFIDEQATTRLPRTFLITMPFDGRIEPIELIEGESVTRGQVVARIVPEDLKLAVDDARANVQRLAASIVENDYDKMEQTSLEQSLLYVESIDATVAAARERVRAGEAKLNYANRNFDRVNQLRATGIVTPDEFDAAQLRQIEADVDYQQDRLVLSALESIRAATVLVPTLVRQYMDRKPLTRDVLEQQKAQAEIDLQRQQISHTRGTMASPINGLVLSRMESNERRVSGGTVLLELGQLDQLEVEVDVLSQDVARVAVGDPVEIYGPAIGPQPARGRVQRIFPAGFTKISSLGIEQQRVKVIVAFETDELARLRATRELGVGFRVRARIITESKEQALVVPRPAVFRGPAGDWQVFVIRDGVVRLQSVSVGLMNDEQVEITDKLKLGDRLVLAPEASLVDGTRVHTNMPRP